MPAIPLSPPGSLAAAPAEPSTVTRRRRVAALAVDLGLLVACQAVAFVLGAAWMLARTGGGDVDLGRGDAAWGTALWLAAVPAWAALLVLETAGRRATPGQSRARMRVEGTTVARLSRLAVHPLATVAWGWLAAVTTIATVPWLPLGLASMAAVTGGAGIVSAALAIWHGNARGLHDLVASTRLVDA